MSEFKKNVSSVKIKKAGCHTALKIVAPHKRTWRQNNIKYMELGLLEKGNLRIFAGVN